ncbi:MAG: LytTR family DNA-binding domain-containing protein [Steroidobacteraceae bacterium]
MTLRALVVDDEQPARTRLVALLLELGQVEVVGEARDAAEALQLLADHEPELLYLDVNMPGMTGLELARHLGRLPAAPAIIFTTAHDEHAMEAFEAEAVGYLLKPIRKEKLATATDRAQRLSRRQLDAIAGPAPRSHLPVRTRDGVRLLRVEDIIYLLAEQKYTTVRHLAGEDLVEDSLRTLEEEFGSRLLRVHRSALVNRDFIEAVERNAEGQHVIRLRGIDKALPVSRRLVGELKTRL